MKEPSWAKFDEICRERGSFSAVSCQSAKVPLFCCRSAIDIASFFLCVRFSSFCLQINQEDHLRYRLAMRMEDDLLDY